jgi:predicted dehydrogenase
VLGCGRWGQHVVRDLVTLNCHVVVADPHAAARELALGSGAAAVVAHVSEIETTDGVVVATPTERHAHDIESLVARDVPVFVAMPFTADVVSAARLSTFARVHPMNHWRHHAGIEAIRAMVAARELGDVVGIRTTRIGWEPTHEGDDLIGRLATHDFAMVSAILGEVPELPHVATERVGERLTGLMAIYGDRPWLALELGIADVVTRRELRVNFTNGAVMLRDPDADHLEILRGSETANGHAPRIEKRAIATEPALLRELRAIRDHLTGRPAPPTTAAEGAAIVRALAGLRMLAAVSH